MSSHDPDRTVEITPQLLRMWGGISIVLCVMMVSPVYAGTITGQIQYLGTITLPKPVNVVRDAEFCGETWSEDPVHVDPKSGGLLGAIVSIDGLQVSLNEPLLSELVLSNKNCRFSPKIGAIQSGQILHLRNVDPILHNTHIFQGKRTILNVAMVPEGRDIRKRLKRPGILLVKCDKHTFMRGHIAVFGHPFFAVTDQHGKFRITGLPSGTHTVTIWHETLGTRTSEVTLPSGGDAMLTIDFSGAP